MRKLYLRKVRVLLPKKGGGLTREEALVEGSKLL